MFVVRIIHYIETFSGQVLWPILGSTIKSKLCLWSKLTNVKHTFVFTPLLRLIGFNSLRVIYDKRLGNRVHCTFIFTFFVKQIYFSLKGATITSQSGSGSNSNERVLHILQIWGLRIRYNLVLYPRTHYFLCERGGWLGVLSWGRSAYFTPRRQD